ncbi:protein of unknown function [Moritella yayanosii]|uniref:Uncharacterized protein n=1 Tax=Moritella yayanosii TaxID=69539 RepID=A0A330LKQ0_9GAMM|nr:protein of unknown function [Moritella yayanosii]
MMKIKLTQLIYLTSKKQLCSTIDKYNLKRKYVKVSYSSINGYFVYTEKYEIEGKVYINVNRELAVVFAHPSYLTSK